MGWRASQAPPGPRPDGRGAVRLARRPRPVRPVPLVPLVDVLLILLVFFMVTSTWLDLDALPLAPPSGTAAPESAPEGEASTLLVRIRGDGAYVLRGRAHDAEGLAAALSEAARPGASVVVLPSGAAPMRSLVAAMEAAGTAGVATVRVVRLRGAE